MEFTIEALDDFVNGCKEFYYWNDIHPGNTSFEKAHHPYPKGMSDDTTNLSWAHHQIHGLWQSEIVGRVCFYSGNTKSYLRSAEAKNLPDYFYETLWKLYWKWTPLANSNLTTEQRSQSATKGYEGMTEETRDNWIVKLQKAMTEDRRKGRSEHMKNLNASFTAEQKSENLRRANQAQTPEQRHERQKKAAETRGVKSLRESASKMNNQKWISLHDGFISHSGGVATHNKHLGIDKRHKAKVPAALHSLISKNDCQSNLYLIAAYSQNPGII